MKRDNKGFQVVLKRRRRTVALALLSLVMILGHAAAQGILVAVADRLRSTLRPQKSKFVFQSWKAQIRTDCSGVNMQELSKLLIIGRKSMRIHGPATAHRRGHFLLFVLKLIQAIVNSTQHQKLLMRPLLAQPAFVENENSVCMLNRAKPMSDYYCRAPFQ